MNSTYAGIVTYNPDIERLSGNINAIVTQVSRLFIIDNGSKNCDEVRELVADIDSVQLTCNAENLGIAKALNQIAALAMEYSAEWVLLLDQDSIVPPDLIHKYGSLTSNDRVAIICPEVVDYNSSNNRIKSASSNEYDEVGMCITSGSYININIYKLLGGFDDNLFIDSVDTEYCIKVCLNGFRILKHNQVVLDHQLGKAQKHGLISTTNHNAMRRYYIARNSIYIARKYKYSDYKMGASHAEYTNHRIQFDNLNSPFWCYLREIRFIFLVLLYEPDKRRKVCGIIKGLIDGEHCYIRWRRQQ